MRSLLTASPVGTGGVHVYRGPGSRAARAGHFLRHLGEMIVAMMVGMGASVPVLWVIFGSVLASTTRGMTPRQVADQFPVLICLVVAISMTLPMVAWMRHRGHEWRSCAEMAAAMFAPLVPIFGLLGLRVIPGASACGLYCAAMIPAMVAAMLLRFNLYTAHSGHQSHAARSCARS